MYNSTEGLNNFFYLSLCQLQIIPDSCLLMTAANILEFEYVHSKDTTKFLVFTI